MMTAMRAIFQGAAGVAALLLLWPAVTFAQQGGVPMGLLDELNRGSSSTAVNPAGPQLSPLDQVRNEQLRQLYQRQLNGGQPGLGVGRAAPGNAAQQGALQQELLPFPNLPFPSPLSPIELDYSRRAGMPLAQYGYDVFRSIIPSLGQPEVGAVASNYRLNIGDELVITLQGQVARSLRTRIDSEGRIVIPDLPPVAAAGRTFGEVRGDLEREVATRYLNTTVFVSVAYVRQIAVSVLGEAIAPGIYHMGGFASALDALAMAGGVKSTGSLRRIMLVRGNATTAIDLYGAMAGIGAAPDLSLADGDRIMVPPIGPTIAVAGEVVRPGIYELPRGETIGGQALLALAGGALRPVGNRFLRFSLASQGGNATTELASLGSASLRAGDILMVAPRNDARIGTVTLDGNVRAPGVRSLASAPDLQRLIGSPNTFLPNPYLLFGAVETTDPQTRTRRVVPVDLAGVIAGRTNMELRDGDIVIVLSLGDVNYLASADVQAVLTGHAPPLLRQHIVTANPRAVTQGPFGPQQLALHPGDAATQLLAQGQASQANLAAQNQQLLTAESQAASLTAASPQQQQQLQAQQQQAAGNAAGSANSLPAIGAPPQGIQPQPAARDFLATQSQQICRGLQELSTIADTARPGRFANAVYAAAASKNSTVAIATDLGNYDLGRI